MVLLSTGVDSSPQPDWQAFHSKLLTSDVQIIAVSLSAAMRTSAEPKKLSPTQTQARSRLAEDFARADDLLKNLASTTGGRAYFPQNREEFARTYHEVSELLRHQYLLAYAPPALDGKVHQLRVEVRRTGFRVGHRPAYLAAASSGPSS